MINIYVNDTLIKLNVSMNYKICDKTCDIYKINDSMQYIKKFSCMYICAHTTDFSSKSFYICMCIIFCLYIILYRIVE